MREQVGRGLDQVAARRQIERRAGKDGAAPESEQGFAGAGVVGIEPQRRLRRVMRGQHARRRRRLFVGRRLIASGCAQHALDRLARQAAGPQQRRLAGAGDDGRLNADLAVGRRRE